tara:strand:- start:285 stop:593 length:309 start_codon:yes stop_codon:yes gene_type:complete
MSDTNSKLDSILDVLNKIFHADSNETTQYKISKHQREYFIDMITAYLSVPSIIMAFYGMNINIPGARHPNTIGLLSIIVAIWVLYVWVFVQRKYRFPVFKKG